MTAAPWTSALDLLRSVDSPTVANAVELFATRDNTTGYTDCSIRSLIPELPPMVGFAVTARLDSTHAGPSVGWGALQQFWELVDEAPKPVVLAFEHVAHDELRADVFGDVMAHVGRRLGAAGLVTNACVRDLRALREMQFPCFARGTVASHGNFSVIDVGRPIVIGGLRITTGDLLHADENGVVLVPREIGLHELAGAVARVQAEDEARIELTRQPEFSLDSVRDDLARHPPDLGTRRAVQP